MSEPTKTYKIRRFYAPHVGKASHDVKGMGGPTLEEAQAHCSDPATSTDRYFDGYECENPDEEMIAQRAKTDAAIRKIIEMGL